VFDPLSARLAQNLSFELGMLPGSLAALAVLGAPDVALLTLSELSEQCRRITRASGTLPIIVDGDHGYGNALNVMRTVEELEAAGAAAVTIEDTELPAAYGTNGPRLVSRDEAVGKMRAARAAVGESGILVFGRTGTPALVGMTEALERLQAYAETGVDALFISGKLSRDELAAIRTATTLPLILGSPGEGLRESGDLAALGVRIALSGHAPFALALEALRDAMTALRENGRFDSRPNTALLRRLSRADDYERWRAMFLGAAGE
jgi:carboxyvinyl-carboxyphosphonate phosphorylmutase